MAKNKIFISYRQSDTQSEASRLKENLEEVFGEENVFFDIETLEPGLNFAKAIEKTIQQSAVVLVLIGENWTEVKDEAGNLRLFKEDDWVRKEVALALEMEDIRVIPVLVKDAKKLSPNQLPDNIKSLADYQWAELTIPRWRNDVEKLISSLEKIIPPVKKEPEKKKFVPPPRPKGWWAKNYLWVLGIFVVLIIIGSWPDENFQEDLIDGNGTEQKNQEELTAEELNQLRESNPEETEVYDNLSLSSPNTNEGIVEDISGYWLLSDNQGNTSTLVFNQYVDDFEFIEYNVLNIEIGEGVGSISGNQLSADYYNSLVQVNGKIKLSTSTNGQSWSGTVSFPTLGTSSNIMLQRINP